MPKTPCRDGRRNNRPPVSGQFKPGQSGHRPGRTPGTRNRRKVLEDELNKTVVVTENGKRVRKRKWDIIVVQQINKSMAGDHRATQYVTDQMFKYGLLNHEPEAKSLNLTPDEDEVFEEIAQRIRASTSLNPAEPLSTENSPISSSETEEDPS